MQMHDFFSDLVVLHPKGVTGVTGVARVTTHAKPASFKQLEQEGARHTFQSECVSASILSPSHATPNSPLDDAETITHESPNFPGFPLPETPVTPVTHDFGLSIAEWQEEYEERAAILEFDGGYPRREAEWHAMSATLFYYTQRCNVSMQSDAFHCFISAICAASRFDPNQGENHA